MSFPRYPKYKDSGVEWLGEVPAHWEVLRFQRCVAIGEGQVDPEDPAYSGMPLIAPNHIESATGRLLLLETAADQGAESGKYLCRAGDVVYSKIRPALRKLCIAPEDSLCSADMYPLRPRLSLDNHFLLWSMLSEQFSALATLESQRVAMPKVNRESLNAVLLPLPPRGEQERIVTVLADETAKIDALVAEQQRLIALLKEKRQAVISHAVTKGLNPDAPMKSSGVEWLGDVPAHWMPVRLGALCSKIGSGKTPLGGAEAYVEEGVLFLRSQNVYDEGLLLDDVAYVPESVDAEMKGSRVLPGDILLNITGASLGRTCIVPSSLGRANVNQHVCILRVSNRADREYIAMVLKSRAMKAQFDAVQNGAAREGLNYHQIARLMLALPPVAEQHAIVARLIEASVVFDALQAEAERAIALLQERRTALISAAVTGKIDVRGLAEAAAEAA